MSTPIAKFSEFEAFSIKHTKKLQEYSFAKNLTEILFILLKHGELKPFVNNVNHENKLCMQLFFEWSELIDCVCFIDYKDVNREQWQSEFKECVSLLLKSGANIFVPDKDEKYGQCFNCIDTLIKTVLQRTEISEFHAHFKNQNQKSRTSNNLITSHSNLITRTCDKNSTVSSMSNKVKTSEKHQNKDELKKNLDTKFIFHFLDQVIKLDTICDGLKRSRQASALSFKRSYMHKRYQSCQSLSSFEFDENQKRYNRLIGNLLQIFMRTHLDDFENAFKLLELLCGFEQKLAALANHGNII